ncbi:iron complex outermembrane recepter protein [Filimonas lacunae]|uniref:Iron complex outermembrane recepter protein n=1 Tax=Filimonas lacunae TaxID=477680 RepID=A0A173MI20_9BACT|nr:TonB-dependent receptor [Filimonas lacunae]BAV07140.1 ferrichrome-iron receptor [Filimonas lacunae]SIS94444.1 iron complex outermembrane recepter protein [Filimonas lacunae]
MTQLLRNSLRAFAIVLLVFCSFLHVFAREGDNENPEKGMITGQITTADNKVAEGVVVRLKSTGKVTTTNENGFYSFKNLPAGSYEIEVTLIGHEPVTKTITLDKDAKKNNISFKLNISQGELDEVVVTAGGNRYKTNGVSPSLRLQSSILETPQNIQVIGSQILADQQVYDIVDGITRNVSGVTRQGHWDNQYANIRMRGSKIPAFRNGMNIEASWGPTAEDASMIERIEFVKGPAGFMLAAGEPGGFYNVVTKKPTGITKGNVSVSMGSFSTYRTAVDLDGKLSKDGRLLYRLNMAAQQKDYFTKYNYSNRYVIAPTLKYLVDDKTSVTFEYTFQGSKYLANGNYSFSTKGFADTGVKNDFFYADPSLEPGKLKDHSVYVYLDHKMSDNWKMHAQVAYFNFSMVANSIWADHMTANGDMVRAFSIGDEAGENRFAQMSFTGEERTGAIRHRIMGGVDFGNKKFWGDFRSLDSSIGLPKGQVFNVYNPIYGISFDSIPAIDRSKSVRVRAGSTTYATVVSYGSVYAQDELGFLNDQLRLSLGLRFTYAETVGKTNTANIKDNVFSPRVGISYSIDKQTSVYGLFDQSFVPVSGTDYFGNGFKPIKGTDLEAGIKKDWMGGRWKTSLTAYTITRKNALVTDTVASHRNGSQTYSIQVGETVTKGIEFDLSGEILPGLNTTINYAYTNSKITKSTDAKQVGIWTANTAAHITNGWLQYRVQRGAFEGFGVNGGIQWQADRYIGSTTVANFPNYFRGDAGLSLQRGKYNISVLVNNVFNNLKLLTAGSTTSAQQYQKNLYNAVNYYSYIVEARRNFRMTISYRF